MTVRVGIVLFPGSNRDIDAVNGLTVAGAEPEILWHESVDLAGVAGILIPGGFAYGDYLRAGVIARFSPVMRAVADFAARGGPVLGICNGFQVLAEARLVPGALLRNRGLRFVCRQVTLLPEHLDSPFTREIGERRPLRMPVAHGEGCYYADEATLDELERDGGVLWRYANPDGSVAGPDDPGNPNGSLRGIAGVRNAAGNVAGLMPHPETAVEAIIGSDDGLGIIRSLVVSAAEWRRRAGSPGTRPPAGDAAVGPGARHDRRDRAPPPRRWASTDVELDAIREKLGREPNGLELAMFSVMWSEHCSYKSSRPLLRTLPTKGEDVVAGIGEQAGVIAIGDGLAVAFKIESHNHPSAVEPYQGAATGVGGILRDIFAMGARPIAVLDALRFGDPSDARTRHLVDGVVRGVGGYGNCVGVPTVGGELVFDPSYQGNPLVNVMAIGLLEDGMLTHASADGPGQPRGPVRQSATGRDGIGGASVLASATFGEQDPSKRPSVQVGDPFAEKLLIEATLEIIAKGLAVSIQDLGAAGITCATCETADRGGTGILVDLDAIPRREPGLEPFEVMISESQERMVAIVEPARWEAVRAVCERWDLPVAIIGRVTEEPDIVVLTGPDGRRRPRRRRQAGPGRRRARPDARPRPRVRGHRVRARVAGPHPSPPGPGPGRGPRARRYAARCAARDPAPSCSALLGSPNLSSRHPVFEQYDSNVQSNTVAGPGPRRGRPADQGHDQGAGRDDGRQRPRRRARPVAGRRPLGGRGRAQRVDHGRPAAGRHELPQLRRPDPAGGLLAARRGRPRPRRRVRGAGPARDRRQRLALQRGARLLDRAHAGDRDRGAARRRRDPGGPGVHGRRQRRRARGRGGPRAGRLRVRPARRAPRPRTGRRRWTSIASGASRRSSARRSPAAWSRAARTCPGAASPSPWRRCACGATAGARLRLPVGDSPAVALFGESPSRLVCEVAPRHVPAFELLARGYGLPVESLGTTGGERLFIELAGRGRHRRRRGAREPDRRRRRRGRRGPPPRLGARPARGRSAGRAAGRATGGPRRPDQ